MNSQKQLFGGLFCPKFIKRKYSVLIDDQTAVLTAAPQFAYHSNLEFTCGCRFQENGDFLVAGSLSPCQGTRGVAIFG